MKEKPIEEEPLHKHFRRSPQEEETSKRIPVQLEEETPAETQPLLQESYKSYTTPKEEALTEAQQDLEKIEQVGNQESKEEEMEVKKEEWGLEEKPTGEVVMTLKEEEEAKPKEEAQPTEWGFNETPREIVNKDEWGVERTQAAPLAQPTQEEAQPVQEVQEEAQPSEEEHEINAVERLKELAKTKKRHPAPAVVAGGRRHHQAGHPHVVPKKNVLVEKRDERRANEMLGEDVKSTETALAKAEYQAEVIKHEEKLAHMDVKAEVTKNRHSKVFASTYFPPEKTRDNNEKIAPGGLGQYNVPMHGHTR